jgi:hypothetical protein
MRPVSPARVCFYCQQPVGESHRADCILIVKKVRVRMTCEYDIIVPGDWDADMVEFHRNESSWCSSNAIKELQDLNDTGPCLCSVVEFEYLHESSRLFLKEQ